MTDSMILRISKSDAAIRYYGKDGELLLAEREKDPRELDEFDAYQNELKELGIEEYINIYKDAYSGFTDATFGN